VIGVTKAGKSTLINYLLDLKILGVAAGKETVNRTRILPHFMSGPSFIVNI
jgi:GTPase Era involved in 16S rRNA processing